MVKTLIERKIETVLAFKFPGVTYVGKILGVPSIWRVDDLKIRNDIRGSEKTRHVSSFQGSRNTSREKEKSED